MTQRLRGITDVEATGPTKDLFDASTVIQGLTDAEFDALQAQDSAFFQLIPGGRSRHG